MKKTNLSLLILVFTLNLGFSQDVINNNDILNQITNQQLGRNNKSDIANIKGSPYINQNFLPAKVDKLPGKDLSARYNAFNDEVEIKKANSSSNYVLNKKSKFSKIEFLSSKIILEAVNYTENGEQKRGYLAQLNPTGNCLLLRKQSVTFTDAKSSKTGYDEGSPAQFKKAKDKYFIKINNEGILELPKNKKNFSKLFPKQGKTLLSYIKREGINFKKETDLIKLINYVNSLN